METTGASPAPAQSPSADSSGGLSGSLGAPLACRDHHLSRGHCRNPHPQEHPGAPWTRCDKAPNYINLILIKWNCLCAVVMGAWGMKQGLEPIPSSWEATGPGGDTVAAGPQVGVLGDPQ